MVGRLVLLAAVAALLSSLSSAATLPVLYSVTHESHENTSLVSMDLTSGTQTVLGVLNDTGANAVLGGVADPQRCAFLISRLANGRSNLYEVSPQEPGDRFLGPGSPSSPSRVTYFRDPNSNNTLYGFQMSGAVPGLFSIDLSKSPISPQWILPAWTYNGRTGMGVTTASFFSNASGVFFVCSWYGVPSGGIQIISLPSGKILFAQDTDMHLSYLNEMWWYDPTRERLTAWVAGGPGSTRALRWYAVDLQGNSTELIHDYSGEQDNQLQNIFISAYDPTTDVFFAKMEGEWHARHRNLSYNAIDPATGQLLSSVLVYKHKIGGGHWVYNGPKITNEFAAFLPPSCPQPPARKDVLS